LIHLSFDNTEDAAIKWAKSFDQPWPAIMQKDIDQDEFITPFFPDGRIGFPTYILVDHNGKEVVRGKAAALAAAKKGAE
jgi:hypothetical protein